MAQAEARANGLILAPALSTGRALSYIAGMKTAPKDSLRARVLVVVARGRVWVRRHIPPGLRLPLGLVLICGGFLGFLPVLGFWMIPLGVVVAAMDLRPLWHWLRGSGR